MNHHDAWLFAATLIACVLIAYICLCRLNLTNRDTKTWVRVKYVLLMTGAITLGGLPVLFQVKHNLLMLIAAVAILILIAVEIGDWSKGPPLCVFNRRCNKS